VKLVDANVLLYAVNEDAVHHEQSQTWLDAALAGAATVGFAWAALLAFLRLSTRRGLFPSPLDVDGALERIAAWLAQPSALVLEPGARHLEVLTDLLAHVGAGGNLVVDAHLAALAIEHRATIVTFDADFGRFPGIRWEQPTLDS
jgi:toxin-antitoxin system PIN domain toxin